MSRTSFQAKVNLLSATPVNGENTVWECQFAFTDNDGAYSGMDILVGDVIVFDTSVVETGSFTLYEVTEIDISDFSTPTLTILYMTVNDNNFGAPDLSWIIGQDAAVSRPSSHMGLLPVVSRDLQLISDKFTEYVQNYNFVRIIDNLQSGDRTFSKTNGTSLPLLKGMAVYVTEADPDQCKSGRATMYETSCVIGLIADAVVPAGSVGAISSKGMLEKATTDWDTITGDIGGLRAGKDYFLRTDMAGGITSTPPFGDGMFIVKIGKAVSSTIIDVNIEPPIEL